jgi:hypothetical protein
VSSPQPAVSVSSASTSSAKTGIRVVIAARPMRSRVRTRGSSRRVAAWRAGKHGFGWRWRRWPRRAPQRPWR